VIRDRHDARPRIEVFDDGTRARYRFGATGMLHDAPSVGDAVETAIAALGGARAVIIFEGRGT
jgi:hypothetical protein